MAPTKPEVSIVGSQGPVVLGQMLCRGCCPHRCLSSLCLAHWTAATSPFEKGIFLTPLLDCLASWKYAAEPCGGAMHQPGTCRSTTCHDGWGLWGNCVCTQGLRDGGPPVPLAEGSGLPRSQGDRRWSVSHKAGEGISACNYYSLATPTFFGENRSEEEDTYSLSCFLCIGDASEIWECPWFCQN